MSWFSSTLMRELEAKSRAEEARSEHRKQEPPQELHAPSLPLAAPSSKPLQSRTSTSSLKTIDSPTSYEMGRKKNNKRNQVGVSAKKPACKDTPLVPSTPTPVTSTLEPTQHRPLTPKPIDSDSSRTRPSSLSFVATETREGSLGSLPRGWTDTTQFSPPSPSLRSVNSITAEVEPKPMHQTVPYGYSSPTLPKEAPFVHSSPRTRYEPLNERPDSAPGSRPSSPYMPTIGRRSLSPPPTHEQYIATYVGISNPLNNPPLSPRSPHITTFDRPRTPPSPPHSLTYPTNDHSMVSNSGQVAQALNFPPRPVQDRRGELLALLRGYSKHISRHIQNVTSSSPGEPNSLRQDVQALYRQFRLEVHRTAPRFRPWEAAFKPQDDSQLIRRMLAAIEADDAPQGKGFIMHINDVMSAINRSRIDDPLGGVPFSVKESLVKQSTSGWKDLANETSRNLRTILTRHLHTLLESNLGSAKSNERLLEWIREILGIELEACWSTMEARINFVYEAEEQIFTLNDQLYTESRTKWIDRYGALLKQSREGGMVELLNRYSTPEVQNEASGFGRVSVSRMSATKNKIDALIEEFASLGVRIQVSDLAKLFPADPMEPAIQLIAEVRAYFEVAYRRFGDAIPQQLHLAYLKGFDDRVDLAFSRFAMDLTPEDCDAFLSNGR